MKPNLCFLALLCLFVNAKAQTQNNGLGVGSHVPDIAITNIINHPTGQARISDYKGKLLILDFWATWCSPCIAMFPKTDSLQKAFADQVVFLPVTYQSKDAVNKLFSGKAKLRDIKPPMVVNDKALHDAFPHSELPHYVWIDGNGTVKAITGSQEVTGQNIQKILQSSTLLPEKKDVRMPYDRNIPLVLNAVRMTAEDLRFGVLLTGYKSALPSRLDIVRDKEDAIVRVSVANYSLKHLYAIANTTDTRLNYNRVILEVADPSRFTMTDWDNASKESKDTWMNSNTYCYEIIVPSFLSAQIFELMRKDLDRLFPLYSAVLEKRTTECLVLERISSTDKIKTSGSPVKFTFDHVEATMVNCSLALLISQLGGVNLQHIKRPMIDMTGYTGKVDISLTGDLSSVDGIRTALRLYDLDLVPRTMEVDMLVIKDRNQN